jgi:hypothetical protein
MIRFFFDFKFHITVSSSFLESSGKINMERGAAIAYAYLLLATPAPLKRPTMLKTALAS